jgi:predicted molibdopterin-dependent oxidoreductase YjgC
MASISVDGRTFEARDGEPLVEALRNNGVYISSLCYVEGLKPYAGCRSCLVQIEGGRGLELSCTASVQDGMVVNTTTDGVLEARRAVVSVILANHSDRCLTCHRREHCHPGDICLRDDIVTHRCLTCVKNYKCELQATCEMVGMSGYEPWVGEERSWYSTPQPLADRSNPFMEFDPQMCIICTRCQRVCEEKRHTSAITLSGRGWDAQIAFGAGGPIHESNCDFSGACLDVCPTAALMEHPNKWVAKPDRWTTTTCNSCSVGCSLHIGSKDGQAVIVRPGDGNEFSGDQICVRGRYHYDSLKQRERLGSHLVRRGRIQAPASLEEATREAANVLKQAAANGKVGVLVGATATNEEAYLARLIAEGAFGGTADSSLGPVMRATKAALEERLGTWRMATDMTRIPAAKTIVVVSDDLEESHNVASVRVKDAVVNNHAMLIVIGALRTELVDFATVWLRPDGGGEGHMADQLARGVASDAAPEGLLGQAANILKASDAADTIIVCAPNPVSAQLAGEMTAGAANVAVAVAGDDASNTLVVLPSEVNVHGLLDQGVASRGGSNPLEGLTGLLVIGEDPSMRLPQASLDSIGTVVALDSVLHPTAKSAEVVIAVGDAYSSTGTYTQGDFRVQRLAYAIAPTGDAVPLFEGLSALATALGVDVPDSPDAALVATSETNQEYQPAADLIIGESVRLDVEASGKAAIVPLPSPWQPAEGLTVITGRDQYTATDAAALRHPEAEKLHRYDRFQFSEEDGQRLGLSTGDTVELSDGTQTLQARITVTDRVPEGAVYVSSLLQGGAVAQFFAATAHPAVKVAAAVTA